MQDGATAKQTVTLPIDGDLLDQAKARGVDVAGVLDRALRRELRDNDGQSGQGTLSEWRRENAAVFAAWNDEVDREGLWNDEHRPF